VFISRSKPAGSPDVADLPAVATASPIETAPRKVPKRSEGHILRQEVEAWKSLTMVRQWLILAIVQQK